MKSRAAQSESRYEALLELLKTAESLWNASRVFFAKWDLSPSQFNVLNLLHLQPDGCSQVELSRQLIMHRSNVTGLVDRLEDRGLVKRTSLPSDRRSINVRADYEYQTWAGFPIQNLHPSVITIGVAYHFHE